MKTIQGPAIFLAQFLGDQPPFSTLDGIADWAAKLGFRGVQLPSWDGRVIDLEKCATSQTYADELKGRLAAKKLAITELSTHLQGQLMAVHPAYGPAFDGFAPEKVRGNDTARRAWAQQQMIWAAQASHRLGLTAHASFTGALAWPFMYPWPQRPKGLVEEAFAELARRWKPVLDEFDRQGVDVCFEAHPGEDVHDGATFERFLKATGNHPRCRLLYDPSHFILQGLDYLEFIDLYHPYIRAFHVKDAEFRPNGRVGAYGGYLDWTERAGRFRSLGDGQVDFGAVFSKLAQYNYPGWAVLEWECCLKHPEDGAKEGVEFIKKNIIRVTERAFDDFAGGGADQAFNRKLLGLG